jgi:hypothetical protein
MVKSDDKDKTVKDNKAEHKSESGILVHATIPKDQNEAIEKLVGTLGVSKNDVVGSIINSWLIQQDWYRELIKERVKQKVEK